jgi:hypothetical protein|nr:MAG TPA: hypothetical protein [Caudoviricetes sp.]
MDPAKQFIKEHHIQTLGGKDDFKEAFSGYQWSAAVIQQPDLLEEYVRLIGLIGATIQDIAVVDYPCLFGSIDPEIWTLEWDNVMVLMTDRGNFEITYSESSSFCISQDCLPKRLYCNEETEDMAIIQKLFSYLKGDTITDVSTKPTSFDNADDEFTGSWNIGLEENLPAYLIECRFVLKSGRQLVFTSDFDWGIISLYDKNNQLVRLDSASN